MKLNAKELRTVDEKAIEEHVRHLKRNSLYFILENVYDTYNIGGLFRLADALCIKKMYLCGETEIPPNARIKKASIGTYKIVPWEYRKTAAEAVAEIRSKESGVTVIAVEQSEHSIPFSDIGYTLPLAFIVGNETFGVTQETLSLADKIAEIPMWGINRSLNVIVSTAIVSYFAACRLFKT